MLQCTDKAQLGNTEKSNKTYMNKKNSQHTGWATWFNYGLDKLKNGGV